MSIIATIRQKITAEFEPIYLNLIDQSAAHSEHQAYAKNNSSGVTHLLIILQSKLFDNIDILARHRKVCSVIAEEFPQIHSISMSLYDSKQMPPASSGL